MSSTNPESYLKMLIVDDEPLMRQGFKLFFDWEKYCIKHVIDVGNGIDAIETASREKPEIIVTDIRMPEIDGLELIKTLKKLLPDSVFIIISGYDDFEYAKQAISLGVLHYLVKPIHSAELHDVMNRCLKRIEEQKRKKEIEAGLNRKLEQSMPALRDNYVLSIMRGDGCDNIEDCLKKLKELEVDIVNKNYTVLYINQKSDNTENYSIKSKMNILIRETLEKSILGLDGQPLKCYASIDVNEVKAVVSWDFCEGIKYLLQKIFNKLNNDMKANFNIELLCGVSSSVRSLEELQIAAEEAERILEYRSMKGEPGILFFEDIPGLHRNRPFFISQAERKKLLSGVENNDLDNIKQVMKSLQISIKEAEYISVGYIYSTLLEIIISVARFTYESGFNIEGYDSKICSQEFLRSFRTMDEMFSWMEEFFIDLSNRFNEFRLKKPKSVIEQITSYITDNISMDITLNKLAEKFYYNPSYLSRMFKEEMNMNFMEYLNVVKIDAAKRFLTSTDMTTFNVCEKIGYKDYKHFLSVFKRMTGMTPNEYKSGGSSRKCSIS